MRTVIRPLAALALFSLLGVPAALAAQAQPPAGLAKVELARSRDCAQPLTHLEGLDQTMRPMLNRLDRLDSVANAVAIEDTSIVSSLRTSDSVEAAVKRWFERDQAMADSIVETDSDSLRAVRQTHRDSIKAFLSRAITGVQAAARAKADSVHAQETEQAAAPCEGMVFVRSAVRKACQGLSSVLCRTAASDSATTSGPYQFVDSASDLWGIQQFLPWTEPTPVQIGPGGALAGARTETSARRGNIEITVAVQPVLRSAKGLDSAQIAQSRAICDSLGFTFDVPNLVMTPALAIQTNLTEPIGGETTYILHFGQLGQADIVWSGPAGSGKPTRVLVPLTPTVLTKLEAGTQLGFSGVKVPKDKTAKAIPVFSIGLVNVNESTAITALAKYTSKQLGEDVKKLLASKTSG